MAFLSKLFKPARLKTPIDLAVLRNDIHSHLIAGIDDGVKTLDESIMLIRQFADMGYKGLYTTPHIMTDYYRNTGSIIGAGLEDLRRAVISAGLDMELQASAEYMVDSGFEDKLVRGDLLSVGKSFVLIEFSYLNPPVNYKQLIFDMQTSGYKVILAHPERYSYWHENLSVLEDLRDRGVYLQLNLVALSGFYGPEVKQAAHKLIERKAYSFAGSDMHNEDYMAAMEAARYEPWLQKLLETNELLNSRL